jgi:hypothetical protein
VISIGDVYKLNSAHDLLLVSGILLREVDSLVEMTRLLDEEQNRNGERTLEAPVPWAAPTTSKNGGRLSKPRLRQEWVDAMDQTGERVTLWFPECICVSHPAPMQPSRYEPG